MCTQLCTLRTGIIVMRLKVQAGNRNGDHQFPGLWDGRRTVLNAGLQSAKSRPHQKLKMEISLYNRSTTVIHHGRSGNVSNAYILAYLKRFRTTETFLKIVSLKHAFWHYLKWFGTAENFFENDISKACILTAFKTIWNCREKMKTMSPKHAFWWYLKKFGTAEK